MAGCAAPCPAHVLTLPLHGAAWFLGSSACGPFSELGSQGIKENTEGRACRTPKMPVRRHGFTNLLTRQ